MSSDGASNAVGDADEAPSQAESEADERETDPAELRARIDVLETENDRLREAYAQTRRTRYRQTALGLAALGVLAALGGLLFSQARSVLFALAGTGLFLGLLTYYLAPEQFLPVSIGNSVYETLARNEGDAVAELGLYDERVYVPVGAATVRLFVPQRTEYEVPDPDALDDVFVVTDDERERGVALEPTGDALVDELERAATGGLSEQPDTLAEQVSDALVEQFELLDSAAADTDAAGGRLTVGVSGSAFGAVDRFDHPVASVLGTACARQLDEPVTTAVRPGDERHDYRVTVTWDTEAETETSPEDRLD